MTKNKDNNVPWPPIISTCPDYWIDIPDKIKPNTIPVPHISGSRCVGTIGNNTGNIQFDPINSNCTDKTLTVCDLKKCDACKTKSINFATRPYIGSQNICAKKRWAGNNVSWDGITGDNNLC